MKWIIEAANQRNAEKQRRGKIERLAPALWESIQEAIKQAVIDYGGASDEFTVGLGLTKADSISVAITEPQINRERERVRIFLNRETCCIEVRSTRLPDQVKTYPFGIDGSGAASVMDGANPISAEEFTELALRDAMFPKEG